MFIFGLHLVSCTSSKVLRIGIAEDQSGSLSDITRQLERGRNLAMELYQKEKNKKTLKIEMMDTINSPEKTANAFKRLIDREHVHLLLGTPSSENAQIAKFISEIRSTPFISNAYDAELLRNTNHTAVLRQNPLQIGQLTALYFFYTMKKNRLAVLYDETLIPSWQSSRGYVQEGRLIGSTMIEESFSSFKRPAEWQVSLSKIQSASPEVVFISADPSNYVELLTIARMVLHIPAIFVLQHMPAAQDLEEEGHLFDQIYVMLSFFPASPSFSDSEFYKIYQQRFGESPGFFSAQGHDEIVFILEMMEKRSHLSLSERFQNLGSYMAEYDNYLTGFKGFMKEGYSFHEIEVLKINGKNMEYLGKYWMEFLSRGSLE